MKPLDFVRTPKGALAIVSEVNSSQCANIKFIGARTTDEHNAWWSADQLEVVDSLPYLLARTMRHPFGDGDRAANRHHKPLDMKPLP